jgi:hypothetical protein
LTIVDVILTLLFVAPNEQWIMSSFKLSPSPDAKRLVMGLRAIAVLGLAAGPANYSVPAAAARDCRDGACRRPIRRHERVTFAVDRLQPLSLVIGAIADAVASPAHPLHIEAGFSINGCLAVLGRVFSEGARMREDLEGTF